jgi:hypothetical protein
MEREGGQTKDESGDLPFNLTSKFPGKGVKMWPAAFHFFNLSE